MSPFHTILHPTDFSSYCREAFRVACSLAEALGARLILLAVNEPIPIAFGQMYPMPTDLASPRETLRGQLLDTEPTVPGLPLERHLVDGHAAEEIVRFATDHHCDLIVMGTHGRTGLGRLLLGSVTEQVVRKAPCPVLTVKPTAHEQPATEKEAETPAGV